MRHGLIAEALGASPTAAGVPALLLGIVAVEGGVPIPVPADLLVIVAGERAAAGAIPLWVAVVLLEVAALVGTTALYTVARGPGRALFTRVLQRLHVLSDRATRLTAATGSRAVIGCAVGRATPGLRTLTVVSAAATSVRAHVAVPALVVGSTVFLQLHLILGFTLGAAADGLLARARSVAIIVLVALAAIAAIVWLVRRGRRDGVHALAEAGCPACLVAAVVAERTMVQRSS